MELNKTAWGTSRLKELQHGKLKLSIWRIGLNPQAVHHGRKFGRNITEFQGTLGPEY